MNLSIGDVVNIVLCVLSFILASLSIVFVVLTLRQNNKMIESSTRPYVTIYYDTIQTLDTIHQYIVLKNFGTSGAIIDSIVVSPKFNFAPPLNRTPFESMQNTFIAPNQSFTTAPFDSNNGDEGKVMNRTYTITYHTDRKSYKDVIIINELSNNDNLYVKSIPSNNATVQKVLAQITEELLRKSI